MNEPLAANADAKDDFSWVRVGRLFAPHRGRVVGVSVLVLVGAVIGIANPLLIQRIFDDGLFPGGDAETDLGLVVTLAVVMLVITFASTALGVVQTIVTNRLGQDVLRELRDRLYSHLQNLSLSFYSSSRTGDLQSRITSDVGGVQAAVTSTLSNSVERGDLRECSDRHAALVVTTHDPVAGNGAVLRAGDATRRQSTRGVHCGNASCDLCDDGGHAGDAVGVGDHAG
jgi:ABC-type multidrug transport system fused ATPase/permease subunit